MLMDCRFCDYKSGPFQQLDEKDLIAISSHCFAREYEKGDQIFSEGHPIGDITYLRNGLLKIQKKIDGGKNVIFQILQAPGYFGLPSVFADKFYHTSAEALTSSEVCFLAKEPFFDLIKKNGNFGLNLLKCNCKSELQYIDHTVTLVRQQVPGRLADVLMFFHRTMTHQNSFTLPLSKAEMAEFMGVSTKSLTRIMTEFKNDGIIKIQGRQIEILRPDLLERLVRLG